MDKVMLTYSEKLIKTEFITKQMHCLETMPKDHEQMKELVRYYGEIFDLVWLFVNDESTFDKYNGNE